VKADVTDHGFCFTQSNRSQDPEFQGGDFTHLLQAQFHQPFHFRPFRWQRETNCGGSGLQVILDAGIQEVR
jgi:hypothetical protein